MNKGIALTLVFMVVSIWLFGCTGKESSGKIKIKSKKASVIEPKKEEILEVITPIYTERLNPFLTKEEEKFFKYSKMRIPIDDLNLSAIFYSDDNNKCRVIIDGQILREGQTIDNRRIVQIQPEAVILEDIRGYSQRQYIIRLKEVITSNENP